MHVLFSTVPDDMGLYDKPMARNVQLWTMAGQLFLDGPGRTAEEIRRAFHTVEAGGTFGYRFQWPAMRVGRHEIYWHRILAAYPTHSDVEILTDAPLGYLTAYPTGGRKGEDPRAGYTIAPNALERPVELWPRLLHRPVLAAAIEHAQSPGDGQKLQTARNVRKLFDATTLTGEPLPRRLARRLLSLPREGSVDGWLKNLPNGELSSGARSLVRSADDPLPRRRGATVPDSLTYGRSARRAFEVEYWKTIAALAEGRFLNKNNADCVRDASTQHLLTYHDRQLDGARRLSCSPITENGSRPAAPARPSPARCPSSGGPILISRGWAAGRKIRTRAGRTRCRLRDSGQAIGRGPSSWATTMTPRTCAIATTRNTAVTAPESPPAGPTTTIPPPPP